MPTSWDCQYLEGLEGYNEEMTQSYLNEYKERIENIKGWIEDKQQENENDENISEVTQERNAEMLINALEKIQEHIDYLDNLENEPQEIYEYWTVTGWLGDKLAE